MHFSVNFMHNCSLTLLPSCRSMFIVKFITMPQEFISQLDQLLLSIGVNFRFVLVVQIGAKNYSKVWTSPS